MAFGPLLAGRSDLVRLDTAAAIAAVGIAFATTLAVGAIPVFVTVRRHAHLVAAGGRSTMAQGSHRLHDWFVRLEIAAAIVVLAGAGLIVRSLINLTRVELGFSSSSILSMGLSIPSRYGAEKTGQQIASLLEEVPGVAGVRQAAVSWDLPVPNASGPVSLTIEGGARYANGNLRDRPLVPGKHLVSPGYFGVFGIPILKGRGFLPSDAAGGMPVTIVSAEMARLHWPGQDPIGRRISNVRPRRDGRMDEPWLTIVGIAADARYGGPAAPMRPQMYVPVAQSPNPNLFLVLKTAGDPSAVLAAARARIASIDPDIAVFDVSTMEDRVAGALADARSTSSVVCAFALVAFVLSTAGLLAAMTGRVARRRRELAVRIALGADRAHLVRLVLAHAVRLIVPATVVGVAVALASARLIASDLFAVSPNDPATFAGAAAVLTVGGLIAAYVPVRRVTEIDAMATLRAD